MKKQSERITTSLIRYARIYGSTETLISSTDGTYKDFKTEVSYDTSVGKKGLIDILANKSQQTGPNQYNMKGLYDGCKVVAESVREGGEVRNGGIDRLVSDPATNICKIDTVPNSNGRKVGTYFNISRKTSLKNSVKGEE